jgi:uncharacterized protein (TIGR03437 family)
MLAVMLRVYGYDTETKYSVIVFILPVEFVGKVPNFDWLTQVNVRLPDGLANIDHVSVSITLHGMTSNKANIRLKP